MEESYRIKEAQLESLEESGATTEQIQQSTYNFDIMRVEGSKRLKNFFTKAGEDEREGEEIKFDLVKSSAQQLMADNLPFSE